MKGRDNTKEANAINSKILANRVKEKYKVGQEVYIRTMEGEAGEKLDESRTTYLTKWTIEKIYPNYILCYRKTRMGDIVHESFSHWEIICNQ